MCYPGKFLMKFGNLGIILGWLGCTAFLCAQEAGKAAPNRQQDEQAIRRVIDQFKQSYNAKDAAEIAKLFTHQAEITSSDSEAVQGRADIEKTFAVLFKDEPKSVMDINVASIRFIGRNTAIEEGTTKVTHAPGTLPEVSTYSVIHVKEEGHWLIASAKDESTTESADVQLQQLDWLIGEWVDESPDAIVKTTYRLSDNKRYIRGEFHVRTAGRPALSGTQRIAWDPVAKQFRSWVFDDQGGFASGLWSHSGNQWMVKLTSTLPGGKNASATNSFQQMSKDRLLFSSRDRVVGGEIMPDIVALPIVRKPPQPASK